MITVRHEEQFLKYVQLMKSLGKTEAQIAMLLGLKTARYRAILHGCLVRELEKKKEAAE